jgi:hypothetical protein
VKVTPDRLWRLSESLLLGFAFTSFFALLTLRYYLISHRLDVPDPVLQTTYPLNEHGQFVYVTWQEFMALKALFWAAIVSFLLAVVVEVRINPFRRNYPFIRSGRE